MKRRKKLTVAKRRRALLSSLEKLEDRSMMAINFLEGFNGFLGTGFTPTPAAGQLDSDFWASSGWDEPTLPTMPFGSTRTTGDYARGSFPGGVTAGGIYAFTQAGNTFLGVQPGGTDFTPGDLTLRVFNDGVVAVNPVISYNVLINNDQGRGNSLNFSYSIDDGANYIPVASLNYTSPDAPDGLGFQTVPKTATLTGVTIGAGQTILLRWTGDDVGGTGSRDEFGIDAITVVAGPANTAPTITAIANVSTRSYEPVTTASFTLNDAQSAATALNVTYTSSNPTLIPVANITTNGTGASRTATIVPAGATGTSTITARVTDPQGLFTETTFTVTVTQAITLRISKTVTGNPGDTIQIPITMDTNGTPAASITGIDIVMLYDTNVLELFPSDGTPFNPGPPVVLPGPPVITIGPGLTLIGGNWNAQGNSDELGKLTASFAAQTGITFHFNSALGGGVIGYINGKIKATAPAGPSAFNMVKTATVGGNTKTTWINEENPLLPLGPNPTSATNDVVTDGIVTVGGVANQPPVNSFPAGPVAGTEDTPIPLTAGNLISVADPDSASVTTVVSVPSTSVGTFAATNGGGSVTPVFSNSNATVTFTGSPTQVNLALATLVFTPAANFNSTVGATTVTVNTTDGTTPDNDTFTINVAAVNDAPTFTAGANPTVAEDSGPHSVAGFASGFNAGPNEGTQALQSYLVSNLTNAGLFSTPPAVALDGTLTYTLTPNANGVATFSLQAIDNGGTPGVNISAPQTVTITVTAVNDAPTFTAGANPTVAEDSGPHAVAGFASGFNAGPNEGTQALQSYLVSNLTNAGLFSTPPAVALDGTLTYTLTPNANGVATFSLQAIDNGGTPGVNISAPQTVTITVTAVNDAPTFTAGANPTVAEDSGPHAVAGFASGFNAGPNEGTQALQSYLVSNLTNAGLFSTPPAVALDGTLTYTLTPNANGVATFSLQAIDNGGTPGVNISAPQTVTITVNSVNDVPVFTVGANQTVGFNAPPQTVTNWATGISAGAPNESGQVLTFTVTANTLSTLFSAGPTIASDGTLTYTPATGVSGTATITLRLSDDGGTANGGVDTSATQQFTITVNPAPVNLPPTINPITPNPLNLTEDAGLQTINLSGISAGGAESQALTVTVSSDNPALIPTPNLTYVPNSATGSFTFTPVANANGTATITVTVRDAGLDGTPNNSDDGITPITLTVNVAAVNDAPTFTAGANPTVAEDSGPHSVAGFASGFNAGPNEGTQALQSYLVSNLTNAGLFSTPPAVALDGTLTYTLTPNANGVATFSLQAIDNGGTPGVNISAPQTVTITVTAVNDAPTFVAGANPTVAEDSGPHSVAGFASGFNAGPNEGSQALQSYLVSNLTNAGLFSTPPAVALDGTLTYTLTPNANGVATFSLQAIDNGGTPGVNISAPQTVTITVNSVNDVPVFTVGPNQTVGFNAPPQTVPFWATGISAGAPNESSQVLTFTVTANTLSTLFSAGPTIASDGTLTYTPATGVSGTATITLRLSDDGGTANGGVDTSATQQFTITVNPAPVNLPPTINPITPNPLNLTEDAGLQTINLSGISAGGAESQALTVTVSSDNPGLIPTPNLTYVPNSATGSFTFTPVANANGTATITVTVRDAGLDGTPNNSDDGITPITLTVNVAAVNDAPTFTAGANPTVAEDSGPHSVAGFASGFNAGPNEGTQALQSYLVSNLTNAGLFSTPPAVALDGTLTYTLTPNANGVATFSLQAIDNGGTPGVNISAPQTVTITVTAVNDAPTFVAGANPTVAEDSGPHSVAGFASGFNAGPNEGTQALQSYLVSNLTNAGLFSTPPAVALDGTLTYTLTPNANGVATFSLQAIDNGGTPGVNISAPQTVTITVTAVNDAPTFTAGANPTVAEDSGPHAVAGFASGFNAGPNEGTQALQSYLVSNLTNAGLFSTPPAVALDGTLTYTLTPNANGVATFSLQAIDNGGTPGVNISAPQTVTITVNSVNDVPVFTVGANQTVGFNAPPQTVTNWATGISAGAPNESGQVLTFTVTANTLSTLFSAGPTIASDGTLTYTPATGVSGTATITLRLSDDGGTANGGVDTSATQQFTITVNPAPVNLPPTINPITPNPLNLTEDAGLQTINLSGISAGGAESQALTVTVSSDNPALIPTPNLTYVPNSATGSFTFTPVANANGTATITVTVRDAGLDGTPNNSDDGITPITLTVNVAAVNDAPTFTAGANPTVAEDSGPHSVAGFASGFNAGPNEGTQALQSYLVSNLTNAGLFSTPPAVALDGTLTYTLTPNANGVATFSLQAIDNGGTPGVNISAPQTVTITVTAVNDAPTFVAGANPTVAEDSGPHSVAGFASGFNAGPNEGSQALQSYLVSNLTNAGLFSTPPAVALDGTLTYTLTPNANGVATFSLQAIDNGGTPGVNISAPQTVTITVTAVNDAPTFTAGANPTVAEDSGPHAVAGFASGFNAGPNEGTQALQSYLVSNLTNAGLFSTPPAVALDGTLTYTLTPNANGVATFSLQAIDNGGTPGVNISAPQTVTITVTAVNDAPTFVAGANPTVAEDSGPHSVAGFASGFNAGPNEGSQALQSYLVSNLTNAGLFSTPPAVALDGTLTYTLTPNANGVATFSLQAIDNGGTPGVNISAPQTVTITVTAVNDAPTFTAGANPTVAEDSGPHAVAGFASGFNAGPNEGSQALQSYLVSNLTNAGLFSTPPAVALDGTLTYTLTPNANGVATFSLQAIDNGGTPGVNISAPQTVTITVTAVNDAPTFTAGANPTVAEDSGPHSVAGFASGFNAGPNEGTQALQSYLVSNLTNAGLFSTPPAVALDGTLTYTLTPNANGVATFSLQAIDNGGTPGVDISAPQTVTITVTAVNDAPTFTAGANPTVAEDSGPHSVAGFASGFNAGPNEGTQALQSYLVSNLTNAGLFSTPPAVALDGTLTYTLTPNANGVATFSLQAIDNGGTPGVNISAPQTVTITVTAVNDAPTFTAGANPTVAEDSGPHSVAGFASGFNAGPNEGTQALQSYLVSNLTNAGLFSTPPAVALDGTLTYTLTPNANGVATFSLQAIDNGGTPGVNISAPQTVTITVNSVNDVPVFTVGPNQTVGFNAPPQTVPFWATGISAGAPNESSQVLTFTVTANTLSTLFSAGPTIASDGTLTYTPATGVSGTATITLRLSDDGGTANGGVDTSATQQFTITVNPAPVNLPPTINPITPNPLNLTEDAGLQTINLSGISAGGAESQALTVTVSSDNPGLIPTPNLTYVPNSATGSFTFTPVANANGTATITVTVRDAGLDGTPNNSDDGITPITLTVNVAAVNDAPTFTAGANPTVAEDSGPHSVAGFASGFNAGPNEGTQALQSYLVSNLTNAGLFSTPPAVALDGTLTYTLTPNANGVATFSLQAIDNGGTPGVNISAPQTVTITVTAVNDAPTFVAGANPTVAEDSGPHSVAGFASGFNAGPNEGSQALQSYLVSNLTNAGLFSTPPAVALDGTLTYTLTPNANGVATFSLQAIDNGGTPGVNISAPQTVTITVTAVNDAPTFTAGANPTVAEDSGPHAVAGFASGFNAGPNEGTQALQSYLVSNLTNAGLFSTPPAVALDGTLTYTLTPNANGVATFSLQAIDNGGTPGVNISAPQTVTITVTAVNDAPTFTAGANPTVAEDSGPHSVAGFASGFNAGPNEGSQALQSYLVSNLTNAGLFSTPPAVALDGTLTYTLTPNANGVATFSLQAIDNGGTPGVNISAPQTVTITVTAVNDAPTFTAGANPTVAEDSGPHAVAGFASGFNAGPNEGTQALQSYLVSNLTNAGLFSTPPAVALDGTLTYTLTPNANGVATFSLQAIDNGGTPGVNISAPQTVTITVNSVNDVPVFTVGANQTVGFNAPPQTVTNWATGISAGAPNESGQVLTFTVTANTLSTLFSAGPTIASDGTLTYTPATGVSGTATITLRLSDDGGTANGGVDTSATQQFTITVNPAPVNLPPTINPITPNPLNLTEDAGLQTINLSGISAGGAESQALTVTVSSDNPALIPTPNLTYVPNSATGSFTFTPVANANGTATITVTVRDAGLDGTPNNSDDGITPITLTVNVAAVNDAPTFTAGPNQTVNEDAGPQTVNPWATAISAGPSDEAGQVLTFNITGNTNPSLFTVLPSISPLGVLTYTPAANANGSATITLTLSDNGGGANTSTAQTFNITINPVNDAPSFTVGPNQTVNEDAGAQTVSGFVTGTSAGPTDEAGQTLSINVTGNSNPSLFSVAPAISPTGTLTYTPAANSFGSATITVDISDNGGTANGGVDTSASQTFTITVNAVNDPPTFTAGPSQSVNEDAGPQSVPTWASAISAGPANESSQTVSFSVTGNSNPSLFSVAPTISPTGGLSYTPAPNANGSATISFQLTDSLDGTSSVQTLTISVAPVNDAPSFTVGPNQTVSEDAGAQIVNSWATAISAGPADEAGQTLSFNITGNTNPALFSVAPTVSPTGVLTYTPAPNVSGTATITLILTDNGGTASGGVDTSGSQSFTISITPVNDPPDASDSTFTTPLNTPLTGNVTVTDPDGPTLTYAVQMAPALGILTSFNTATGAFTYTPNTGATGLDLFTFSVSDGTFTDTATVRISIQSSTPVVTASGGNIQVVGTPAEDVVIISRGPTGQALVRSSAGGVNSSALYPLGANGTLTISTGDAKDYIVVNGITNATNIDAGSGDDYVSAGTGDDTIIGGAGNDQINASGGNNTVWGDEVGQQDLAAGGDDILSSLGGNDTMYGGGGADQLYPGDGVDYAYAGEGADTVSAGGGNDRVFGGGGDDLLVGDGGDDVVSGGSGNDFLLGGDGNDVLIGGTGVDSINGGSGNDLIVGGNTTNSASSAPGDSNDVALMALLAAWNVSHAPGLASGMVSGDDGVADSLSGYLGDDDFYAYPSDSLGDFNTPSMGTDRRFP